MGAFTSYIVDNDRTFRDAIKRASEVSSDLRIPFGQILSDFYRSEKAIFTLTRAGQYPDFKNGGENSPYAKYKKKKFGFTYPLLKRTGKLADSLLSAHAPGSVSLVGKTQLIIGTSISYGIYHQSDAPRSKIPLRKFLFIGPEAPRFADSDQAGRPGRWMDILNDYVLAKMKQSGAFQ